MLRKMLWLTACMLSAIVTVSAREVFVPACEIPVSAREVFVRDTLVQSSPAPSHEVTFRFVAGNDMLFSPWGGNGESLRQLSGFIDAHRAAILSGEVPVRVYGYCASAGTPSVRLRRARLMSNRVKTEMILRGGLREEHFRTENSSEVCGELRNAVVVRIVLPPTVPAGTAAGEEILRSASAGTSASASSRHSERSEDSLLPASTDASAGASASSSADIFADASARHSECSEDSLLPASADTSASTSADISADTSAGASASAVTSFRRWSFGLHLGIPFFWGDMLSLSSDKTYLGFSAGVQADYRFSGFLGVSLSADYARGKAGAPGYAQSYGLSPSGMTLYRNGTETSRPYKELYSRISVVNVGLGLDVYLNRLFGAHAAGSRFQAVLTPTVYGQFFNAGIYNKVDDTKFSDGTTQPDGVSLGLGGALSLRCRIAPAWSLQLKNSLLWITDNKFDGIVTPYDHARQNVLWLPQAGVVWNP